MRSDSVVDKSSAVYNVIKLTDINMNISNTTSIKKTNGHFYLPI